MLLSQTSSMEIIITRCVKCFIGVLCHFAALIMVTNELPGSRRSVYVAVEDMCGHVKQNAENDIYIQGLSENHYSNHHHTRTSP